MRGIAELAELPEHVGQLVAALAAAHVHDHVRVAPLRDLLEQDRLAGTEAAGHRAAAALDHREQHVDHALPGEQRRAGRQPLTVGPRAADRPRGGQPDVGAGDGGDHRVARHRPRLAYLLDRAAEPGRHQHPVADPARGGRRAKALALADGRARRHLRREVELSSPPVPNSCPGSSQAGAPLSGRSSPSNTPPSRCGPSRADSGSPSERGRIARREAAGVLVRLHSRHVAADGDGLTGQPARAELDDVVHRHPGQPGHFHQRPVHPHDPREFLACLGRSPLMVPTASSPWSPSASRPRRASLGSEQSTMTWPDRARTPPSGRAVTVASGPAARRGQDGEPLEQQPRSQDRHAARRLARGSGGATRRRPRAERRARSPVPAPGHGCARRRRAVPPPPGPAPRRRVRRARRPAAPG